MTDEIKRLPLESNEEYAKFKKDYEAYRAKSNLINTMYEEEARARNDKLIFIMSKVDIWLLRLILVLLLVLAAAQIYILW